MNSDVELSHVQLNGAAFEAVGGSGTVSRVAIKDAASFKVADGFTGQVNYLFAQGTPVYVLGGAEVKNALIVGANDTVPLTPIREMGGVYGGVWLVPSLDVSQSTVIKDVVVEGRVHILATQADIGQEVRRALVPQKTRSKATSCEVAYRGARRAKR